MKGEFWLDLISTIPFDSLLEMFDKGSGDKFVGLSMIKLTRVLRIQKLIMYLNSTDEVKNTLNLVKTVLTIVLYLHVKGSIWFYIINQEKLWYPANWNCPKCVEERAFFTNDTKIDKASFIFNQFLLSVYTAILEMNGNDIDPSTGFEMFMTIIGLLMGNFMNAYIFGNLVV